MGILNSLKPALLLFFLSTSTTVVCGQSTFEISLSKPGQDGALIAKLNDVSLVVKGEATSKVTITVSENGKASDAAGLLFDFFETNNTVTIIRKTGIRKNKLTLNIIVPRNFLLSLETYWDETVEITDIDRAVSAKSHGGNIKLTNIKGNTVAKSHFGFVLINNLIGKLEVSSFSGNIRVSNIAGSAIADNTQGNIWMSFSTVLQDYPMSFTNIHGKIEIMFPPDLKCDLSIENFKGKTTSDFNLEPITDQHEVYDRKISGITIHRKISGGGVKISFKNLSGDILIRSTKVKLIKP